MPRKPRDFSFRLWEFPVVVKRVEDALRLMLGVGCSVKLTHEQWGLLAEAALHAVDGELG